MRRRNRKRYSKMKRRSRRRFCAPTEQAVAVSVYDLYQPLSDEKPEGGTRASVRPLSCL